MIFRIKTKYSQSKVQILFKSLHFARISILHHEFGAAEIELNNYLCTHYNQGLKPICLKLIYKLTANQVSPNELIYSFLDPKDDELAQLITYGVGNLPGSNILINALR